MKVALLSIALLGALESPADAVTAAQRAKARKAVKVLDAYEAQIRRRLQELERGLKSHRGHR